MTKEDKDTSIWRRRCEEAERQLNELEKQLRLKMSRCKNTEASLKTLRDVLEQIAEHAVCDLPEETSPPRNRLQWIYTKATTALAKVRT